MTGTAVVAALDVAAMVATAKVRQLSTVGSTTTNIELVAEPGETIFFQIDFFVFLFLVIISEYIYV